jgi:hypothetical protein
MAEARAEVAVKILECHGAVAIQGSGRGQSVPSLADGGGVPREEVLQQPLANQDLTQAVSKQSHVSRCMTWSIT